MTGTDPAGEKIIREARACRICAAAIGFEPRPVFRISPVAKVLIIGQAPGNRVHQTGVPWNDPSGDRLRDWLQIGREQFYEDARIGILPMGFCFPGNDAKGGDLPPRPECAPLWHEALRALMPDVELTLLIGQYAQKRYLGKARQKTLTATVQHWQDYRPGFLPLPHPSWRNTGWLKKNPWFETDLLSVLRSETARLLG